MERICRDDECAGNPSESDFRRQSVTYSAGEQAAREGYLAAAESLTAIHVHGLNSLLFGTAVALLVLGADFAMMTTYHHASVGDQKLFYREAGSKKNPTIVLLHGFPSSSHMFRELIPKIAEHFHVIAPDYPGFGYSDAPDAKHFQYTFDNLAEHVERLLFEALGLKKFSIYVQDYGAPVGYRIASRHPDAIEGIVVQNGNAYAEGIGAAFNPMKPFWKERTAVTETPVRTLLTKETTIFQYTHGVKDTTVISPDAYTVDQFFLDRPGNDAIQLDLLHDYQSNVGLYDKWHEYFRVKQPRMLIVWGINDPFFTVEGAKAYQRDLPHAELHLIDTGHFALEDSADFIAERIKQFLR